ncbi:MAG: hypothetical protein EOP48_29795 [Sphingobacteriales bacterium]|nr:MAG: hypothetical protein EOP48_29795 [Sphingobacteriales bacterium]
MRHTLIFITTLLMLASCQTNSSSHSDTFQVLLPDTTKTHRQNALYEHLKGYGIQMNLPRIDTGVKGFELRIWTGSMIDPDQMVLLRKSDTITIAQKFDYNSNFDSLEHYKIINSYNSNELTRFVDSLQKLDFTTMVSQNEIQGFNDNVADGMTYYMEISTPKYYKLVAYHCPEHFAKSEANNKKFVDLLLAVDKHVHFYSPICSF